MATGGFRSNATTDFLEEWKAKREKMRAKMLGDIAASTGATVPGLAPQGNNRSELNNNSISTPERPAQVHALSSLPSARSTSPRADPQGGSPKKPPTTPVTEAGHNSDKDSPSPGNGSSKAKDKKSSGPSARKGKGQIEKRKLREKRRSTGVVNIPSNESLDELDDDEGGSKERKEEALTQHNTVQNETMGSDHLLQETPKGVTGRYKSGTGQGCDDDSGGSSRHRQGHSRHDRDISTANTAGLEKKIEELLKELSTERQENSRLAKSLQEKEEVIVKLKDEIDLLYRDLDDIEDENEQLKQENKTLLKVVGQLTR